MAQNEQDQGGVSNELPPNPPRRYLVFGPIEKPEADLALPAIMTYLDRHGLRFLGTEVVDIGSWEGQASHPISIRLSPLHIHVVGDPKMTLEQFWQQRKCLAVWEDE